MKSIFLIVLVFFIIPFNCEAYYKGNSQKDKDMRKAYIQIEKKDNEKAISHVEANLDYAKPTMMWAASNAAYKKNQLTRSAFLFYAGWLRIIHDENCYVPDEESKKEALGALWVMRVTLGAWIGKRLKHSDKVRDGVVTAIQKYDLRPSEDYTPDWKVNKKYEWNACKEKVLIQKNEMIKKLKNL